MTNILKISALFAVLATVTAHAADDILVADFEGADYGLWKVEGTAFGSAPAGGALPNQMPVTGFRGKGLVNSFHGGDDSTGRLTSPPIQIERKYVAFLIGGGGWPGETCINLLVDGKVVRSATGSNTSPGGSEKLEASGWDVSEFAGKTAVVQIVDERKGGWGHINVDQIVQTDIQPPLAQAMITLEKMLTVDNTHLLVPVSNTAKGPGNNLLLGIYDGDALVQDFTVTLPQDGHASWLAAYPLAHFGLQGKQIRIALVDKKKAPESCRAAFEQIKIGAASEVLSANDYAQPYRNQFHASPRRGWNNDPNGMVFYGGKYHLYFQHNPFGIQWGNMHWGHLESTDLIHWMEVPIALYQKTVQDMAFSGGGFLDRGDTAGLGKDAQFVAFTSTGRGECLAYSKDGGLTFTELPENPVVKHKGRDPKVIWYQPEQKWVMALYDEDACPETNATPPRAGTDPRNHNHIAFWESKNLHQWTRAGAFTDPDRSAVFECPEMFEMPVQGKPGETRWILLAAQNRYFIGQFDGKTFHKESGPHGTTHGAFYAAQTFSDVPDGRRIQIGWMRPDTYLEKYPDQLVSMAFTLPHELALRETADGLRICFAPVKEVEQLRAETLAEGHDLTAEKAGELLRKCAGQLSEVQIEFAEPGAKQLVINGMDAGFDGRSARIFTDRIINEVYAGDGTSYELRKAPVKDFPSAETKLVSPSAVRSLRIYRLNSIWDTN